MATPGRSPALSVITALAFLVICRAAEQCTCASEALLDNDCCQCTKGQVANAVTYFGEVLAELVETPFFRVYAPYPDQPGKELYDVECSIPEFQELAQELSELHLGCAIEQCGCSAQGADTCALEKWRLEPCFQQCEDAAHKSKAHVENLAPTRPINVGNAGPLLYNLLDNPEQFTGYGTLLEDRSAALIWESLYTDKVCLTSCPDLAEAETHAGERFIFRVVSGLQASVNTHIAMHYGFYADSDEPTTRSNWKTGRGLYFAPWKQLFDERVGQHPTRIQNMHFVFAMLTRALHLLKPKLQMLLDVGSQSCSDCAASANNTRQLLEALLSPPPDAPAECDAILTAFDAGALFPDNSTEVHLLKADVLKRFQRMGHIMTCVGCDRCKLWGSLQFHAARVALGLLLQDRDDRTEKPADQFEVPRVADVRPNDVVALVNALAQLSKSIKQVREWTPSSAASLAEA